MKNLAKFYSAAFFALVSFCAVGADSQPAWASLVDLTGTGKGTASSMYSSGWTDGSAATAFDDNFDNRAIYKSQTVDWIWTFNEATVVNAYKLYAPKSTYYYYDKRMPMTWSFQGKNSADADWTTLDTREETATWGAYEGRYFQFDNTTAYDSYRIYSTAAASGNDGYTQIAELEFFHVQKEYVTPMNFSAYVTFTVSGYEGSTSLEFFPMLVKLSESISGFKYSDCPQASIRFTASDETGEFVLPFEVDTWDDTGTSYLWVMVPTISGTATQVKMYYGGSGSEEPSSDGNVWSASGYKSVWHLNIADGATTDSVAAYAGTVLNANDYCGASTGIVGGDYLNVQNLDALHGIKTTALAGFVGSGSGTVTYSAWVRQVGGTAASAQPDPETYPQIKWTSSYGNCGVIWNSKNGGTSSGQSGIELCLEGKATQYKKMVLRSSSTTTADVSNPESLYDKAWHYMVVRFDGTNRELWIDGVQQANFTATGKYAAPSGTVRMGARTDDNESCVWTGDLDEMRCRAACASDDWIAAEYANIASYDSFVTAAQAYTDSSSIKFDGNAAVTKESGVFKLSVTTADNSGTGTITAKYGTSDLYDLSAVMTTAAAASTTYNVTMSDLTADTSYTARAEGENAKGTITKAAANEAFYNGTLTIAAGDDADEKSLSTPGTITVSRADTYGDLVVNYTTGGTAVSNVNYIALSGSITITNGASSATIEVYPLRTKDGDHTLEITLADGLYFVDDSAKTATITIKTLVAPAGYNTWIAEADGNASVAANWSVGVPSSSDNILVDGRYSTASMTWDAGENGLPDTVASWTQAEDYTGTITMNTVYSGKGDFETFTVTGALTINGGVWTHPQSRTTADWIDDYVSDLKANETYRIKIACGSLVLGANARMDATNKGYYQANTGSVTLNAPVHGGMFASSTMSPYGDPKEPAHIGLGSKPASGTYTIGIGGGAIYIIVSGTATVNGTIKADTGSDPWSRGLTLRGGAAAGSVYLKAASVTGTGTISASARSTDEQNGRGCGGRVAVIATGSAIDRTALTLAATVYPYKSGTSESSSYGSCGTVYVKDTTTGSNGMLIIDNETSMPNWGMGRGVTIPTADGDWTFDKLALGHKAILAIPVGTTLHLPNGLASVSSLNDASSTAYGSIRYEGGTLDVGSGDQTMSGNWMLTGYSNCVLNCNLTVQDGAAIGVPALSSVKDADANADVSARTLSPFISSTVTVNGNLNVTATGKLVADYCGFVKYSHNNPWQYCGVLGYGNHGGRHKAKGVGDYLAPTNFYYKGYDSAFSPALPGCSGWYGNGSSSAGGAMKLVVSGALTLEGAATANGSPVTKYANQNDAGGPGGSIDITAGTISGSGTIDANGGSISSTQGGGGRVAIKLTQAGADFSNFATANINASGRYYNGASDNRESSSSGTIYLQTASEADKRGSVMIKCKLAADYYSAKNSNTTEMVSLGYGCDPVADYKKVNYVVSDYGRAAVNTDFQAKSVKLATMDAFLDLEGNDLTVSKFQYAVTDGETTSIKKLPAGTYSVDPSDGQLAFPSACANVYDSVSGGTLTVQPAGLVIFCR